MSIGSKVSLVCPPHWAYGEEGEPSLGVKPHATLYYVIELKSFKGSINKDSSTSH